VLLVDLRPEFVTTGTCFFEVLHLVESPVVVKAGGQNPAKAEKTVASPTEFEPGRDLKKP
jgi:hypothetical protein